MALIFGPDGNFHGVFGGYMPAIRKPSKSSEGESCSKPSAFPNGGYSKPDAGANDDDRAIRTEQAMIPAIDVATIQGLEPV